MDLHDIETYLHPKTLQELGQWQDGQTWLAGGTWIFSEPQPQIRTLVDLQGLGWSELEVVTDGLIIGATCILSQLLKFDYPAEWRAIAALQAAVHELASFKVQNVATVAGNLCLAIPAGTLAPVMLLLKANYEILALDGSARWVAAAAFQTGAKQTLLQPGEVLRRIQIPAEMLTWRTNYQRLCVASAGLAIAIVVTAYNPTTAQVQFAIGAAFPAPRLLEFSSIPTLEEISATIQAQSGFLHDSTSATYRQQMVQVLMTRSLQALVQTD